MHHQRGQPLRVMLHAVISVTMTLLAPARPDPPLQRPNPLITSPPLTPTPALNPPTFLDTEV